MKKYVLFLIIIFSGISFYTIYDRMKQSALESRTSYEKIINKKILLIAVLGSGSATAEPSKTLKARLDLAFNLYSTNVGGTTFFLSGGSDKIQPIAESKIMKKYLLNKSVDAKIVLDVYSNNTLQNIHELHKYMGNTLIKSTNILIVTSDYHCYRVKKILHDLLLNDAVCVGTNDLKKISLKKLVREILACIKYQIFFQLKKGYYDSTVY